MQSEHINPFLESATIVIEQMIAVKPARGELKVKKVSISEGHLWLSISVIGNMKGDILFGFPEEVALKLAGAMMGGFVLTEVDEMCKSAISELGNMISGNASTLLYNQGVVIDITPPKLVQQSSDLGSGKAICIPIRIEGIGEFEILVFLL